MKKINLVGYASGVGAGNPGCADGPAYLQQSNCLAQLAQQANVEFVWQMVYPQLELQDKYKIIGEISRQLASKTSALTHAKEALAIIAGDHSCGVGSWSGVASALRAQGDIGLIWIDAHLDANTDDTTPSGNIHGMPVAALLGYGREELTHVADELPKLKPENLCFIGIRSYDAGEENLLKQLGVRIYYIEEVLQRGFAAVFAEALSIVKKNTIGFGVSLDLDALDPQFTPGTGTPEPNGLELSSVTKAFQQLANDSKFLGLEIAEFNPHECPDGRTAQVICDLLRAVYISGSGLTY